MTRAWRMGLLAAGIGALALGGALETIRWIDTFSGEICIGLGGNENVAVRLPVPDRLPFLPGRMPVLRDRPLAAIPFQTPEVSTKYLDDSGRYDALALPFTIRLKRATPIGGGESRDELKISEPEQERTEEIAPGKRIELQGKDYRVEAIRPWSGLIREPNGTAMAMVSLRQNGGTWTEGLFIISETWRSLEPSIGLRFQWAGSEEAANSMLDNGLPGIESARWGVADGSAMNWFEAFTPHAGVALSNGAAVQLVSVEERHATPAGPQPAIEVEWNETGRTRREWIIANAPGHDAPVRFEYPSRLDTVILIGGVSSDRAHLAIYEKGSLIGREAVSTGTPWKPSGATVEIRVDQMMDRAVAVPASETRISEVILRRDDESNDGQEGAKGTADQRPSQASSHRPQTSNLIRVREGEAVRQDDALIQFTRHTRPPDVKYELVFLGKDGKQEQQAVITPGDTVRYENGRLAQAPPCDDPLRAAVLHVEYTSGRAWPRLLIAAALALLVWVAIQPSRTMGGAQGPLENDPLR